MSVLYAYNNKQCETMDFLRLLYHDKRGGQMIRLRKSGEDVSQMSTCDVAELAPTGTDQAHYYTTVNTFFGWKRAADQVYNIGCIYIDLDCHSKYPLEIGDAKERTAKLLDMAYATGIIAVPTMITDTGRGFGIYYVLSRSIANTDRNKRQRDFFRRVRKGIFGKYKDLMELDPMAAKADATVLDDSRICRLPGTYNVNAGSYCRLIYASEQYFDLSDLVKQCHLWTWVSDEQYAKKIEEREKARKKPENGKRLAWDVFKLPFLQLRIEQLQKLQDLRGKACTNSCRDQILFIAYSALVQLDRTTAPQKLQKLNDRFVEPLKLSELEHIIKVTDNNVGYDHQGYYKLKTDYVIGTLDMSDEEIKATGIGNCGKRSVERQIARNKRAEKKKKIVELLKQADVLTYEEIAKIAEVSRRTVCTIAKNTGLSRYHKSANSANKSVCVPVVSCPAGVLSTPVVMGEGEEEIDWYDWLSTYAAVSDVARELYHLYRWSTSFILGGTSIEAFFDSQMPSVVAHPERLQLMLDNTARLYVDTYGTDECVCTLQEDIIDYPSILKLCAQQRRKSGRKKWITDLETETLDQRNARIERHLERYEDMRFGIIESTDEYRRRLDFDVLHNFKITCMQVRRLKRDYLYIEGQKIPTAEIRQCFDSLTYKDIVIICERMGHQGTIKSVEKPFFYAVQVVYKYRHPELAEVQLNRIVAEKSNNKKKNKFNNLEQRDVDFDWIEANAVRELMGLPVLTHEEYCALMKGRA